MSALAADALAGIAVAATPGANGDEPGAGGDKQGLAGGSGAARGEKPSAAGGKSETARCLVRGLAELGAELVANDGSADLIVVAVDGAGRPSDRGASPPVADPSLDGAADGALAGALTEAFAAAREAFGRLRPGGCLLFVLAGAAANHADVDAERAAIGSLTRTLALEWAPERRVNALVCANPEDAIEVVALIAWPASRTLTGTVLDVVGDGQRSGAL
jgi:hypothetical protein